MMQISDSRKIGTVLLFLGMLFLTLGVMFLFDRKLLAMGNILFLSGFSFLSGAKRTLFFFGIWGDRVMDRRVCVCVRACCCAVGRAPQLRGSYRGDPARRCSSAQKRCLRAAAASLWPLASRRPLRAPPLADGAPAER